MTSAVDFFLFLLPELFIILNVFPEYTEAFYIVMFNKSFVDVGIYTLRHRELNVALSHFLPKKLCSRNNQTS